MFGGQARVGGWEVLRPASLKLPPWGKAWTRREQAPALRCVRSFGSPVQGVSCTRRVAFLRLPLGEELYETRSVSRSFSSSAEHRRFRERNRKTSWQRLMRDCTKQNIALCCADCLYALIRHASRATFPTGEGLDAAGMFPPNRCNHCRDQRSQRFAPAAAKNQAAVKPPGYPKNPFYSSTLSRLLACIDIRMMISANLCSSIGKPLLTHSFSSSSAPLTQ